MKVIFSRFCWSSAVQTGRVTNSNSDFIISVIQAPNSQKVGTLFKMLIKKEHNYLQISKIHILSIIEHRKHVKCLN